jgi:hypothetical protein
VQQHDPGQDLNLGGRFQIHPDKPLPKHDTLCATAYEASDRRMPHRRMMAMLCKPGLVPRLDIIPQLSRLNRLPVINPIDAGSVGWPETGGRRFVVLFDRANGEPLQYNLDQEFTPLREDQVFHHVIKQVLPALKELSGRGIKHRAIRVSNLYFTDSTRQSAVLGECVSGPPGMCQPVLYEPIDSGMSDPAGRGQGTQGDDLYAFGVLIAVLLTGRNPAKGMNDTELIESKINHGSYATLVGDLRLSLRMIEPLRGLLCDIPKERWTVEELELWAGGRQLSPKQPMLPIKANRTIQFKGQDYLTRASLSLAMRQDMKQAAQLIACGEVSNWLRRSYGDEESADAVDKLIQNSGGSNGESLMAANALIVLDSTHPLHYRDIAARIEGLTTMLAVNYDDAAFREEFTEMIRAKLPQIFLQSGQIKGPDIVPMMKNFEMVAYFLDRPKIGSGIERALYESNRGWPCRSPIIADDYVCELEDLLPALERAARRGALGDKMVDRHIAAFCAARSKYLVDTVDKCLGPTTDPVREHIGTLTLYAEVQRLTAKSEKFPALTAWLAAKMTPVIESYHNREVAERLRKQVDRVGGQGDPMALLEILDNADEIQADKMGFAKAKREYGALENSITWLTEGGMASSEYLVPRSNQAATFVSAVLSGLTVVAMTILYVV